MEINITIVVTTRTDDGEGKMLMVVYRSTTVYRWIPRSCCKTSLPFYVFWQRVQGITTARAADYKIEFDCGAGGGGGGVNKVKAYSSNMIWCLRETGFSS